MDSDIRKTNNELLQELILIVKSYSRDIREIRDDIRYIKNNMEIYRKMKPKPEPEPISKGWFY